MPKFNKFNMPKKSGGLNFGTKNESSFKRERFPEHQVSSPGKFLDAIGGIMGVIGGGDGEGGGGLMDKLNLGKKNDIPEGVMNSPQMGEIEQSKKDAIEVKPTTGDILKSQETQDAIMSEKPKLEGPEAPEAPKHQAQLRKQKRLDKITARREKKGKEGLTDRQIRLQKEVDMTAEEFSAHRKQKRAEIGKSLEALGQSGTFKEGAPSYIEYENYMAKSEAQQMANDAAREKTEADKLESKQIVPGVGEDPNKTVSITDIGKQRKTVETIEEQTAEENNEMWDVGYEDETMSV